MAVDRFLFISYGGGMQAVHLWGDVSETEHPHGVQPIPFEPREEV